MTPDIPTTTANRMAKEYLVYRAVYLNIKSIQQYFTLNHSGDRAFNAILSGDSELCLYLAVSAIKLSEVCSYTIMCQIKKNIVYIDVCKAR